MDTWRTNTPRFFLVRTSPSDSSARNASRTGPRETFSWLATSPSLSLSPGESSPERMRSSRSRRTSVVREWLRRSSIAEVGAAAIVLRVLEYLDIKPAEFVDCQQSVILPPYLAGPPQTPWEGLYETPYPVGYRRSAWLSRRHFRRLGAEDRTPGVYRARDGSAQGLHRIVREAKSQH